MARKKLDLGTIVGWVRLVGFFEAVSFIALLGIAVPMKRIFGDPTLVPPVGMTHGVLILIYWMLLLIAWLQKDIPFRHAALAFFAALLPFGPFFVDGKLEADQEASAEKPE